MKGGQYLFLRGKTYPFHFDTTHFSLYIKNQSYQLCQHGYIIQQVGFFKTNSIERSAAVVLLMMNHLLFCLIS